MDIHIQTRRAPYCLYPSTLKFGDFDFRIKQKRFLKYKRIEHFNSQCSANIRFCSIWHSFFIKLFLLLFSSIQRFKIYSVPYSYCLYISLTIPRILSIKESGARTFKDEPYESNSCTKSSVGRNLIRNVIESSSCDIRT